MSNPYDDIFGAPANDEPSKEQSAPTPDAPKDAYEMDGAEPLDEILTSIAEFNETAVSFSKLLTQTRAVDHEIRSSLLKYFVFQEDNHNQGSLAGERKYHALLMQKFERIIGPMKELASMHLETVKQFNRDIGKDYYSVEKTDSTIKSEKTSAIEGINLQRKILADAASSLGILENALAVTEQRIQQYVNTGGVNNISNVARYLLKRNDSSIPQ